MFNVNGKKKKKKQTMFWRQSAKRAAKENLFME